jgi:translation elongation factor EF-Ts|tara:strand:- start:179 stop:535 length:357 start_codon:yes stop_codon:yes gene_type:complete
MQTQTQQLKTITVQTSNLVESVHMETLYKVIENCFNSLQIVEADCTSASYFLNSANIFAQLQQLYVDNESNNYVSLQSVMDVFANNITYYDESSLFTTVVENTVLQNVLIENYVYLSN